MDGDATRLEDPERFFHRQLGVPLNVLEHLVADDKVVGAILEALQIEQVVIGKVRLLDLAIAKTHPRAQLRGV